MLTFVGGALLVRRSTCVGLNGVEGAAGGGGDFFSMVIFLAVVQVAFGYSPLWEERFSPLWPQCFGAVVAVVV